MLVMWYNYRHNGAAKTSFSSSTCVCVCACVQAALRHSDEKKLCVLQQLQAESQRSIAARSKLETLCRELQGYYDTLRVCRWS